MTDSVRLQLTALALIVVTLILGGLEVSCSPGDDHRQTSPADELPDYQSTVLATGRLEVLTDATEPQDLREIFDDVRDKRTEGNSWRVTIRCASVPRTDSNDPVLATGRFANTQQGLVETGLADTDDVQFATTGRAECAPGPPTVPGAVTPEQVIATVEGAGLAVPNPRDSSNFCAELDCVRRTTTDAFTITVWPSRQAAATWADAVPLDVVRLGPVTTVEFTQGRRAFPFPDDPRRDAYVEALAPLR